MSQSSKGLVYSICTHEPILELKEMADAYRCVYRFVV